MWLCALCVHVCVVGGGEMKRWWTNLSDATRRPTHQYWILFILHLTEPDFGSGRQNCWLAYLYRCGMYGTYLAHTNGTVTTPKSTHPGSRNLSVGTGLCMIHE